MTVGGRVEICSFASLIRAYEREGLRLRSKSDAIWQAVEQLVLLYSKKHQIEPFTDVREAVEYMVKIGMPLDTNTQAIRALGRAKTFQDAVDDYGVDDLEVQSKKVRYTGVRKSSVVEPIVPTYRTEEEMYQDLYKQARELGYKDSYEAYRGKVKESRQILEETVVATSNPKEFVKKEEERLTAEKAAYSPEALRAAMVNKLP
jgi:hypothetical protein